MKSPHVFSHDFRPDSSRFPVVAAGQLFSTENDGSIHVWTRRRSGMRKRALLPICSLEVMLVLTIINSISSNGNGI